MTLLYDVVQGGLLPEWLLLIISVVAVRDIE